MWDQGLRESLANADRERLKELERELKQASEILGEGVNINISDTNVTQSNLVFVSQRASL